MSTILEAQAVIKAKDATGGTFEAIAQKVARLNHMARLLNRDVQKQIEIGRAAEQHISRIQRMSSAIATGVKMGAAATAAYQGSRIAAAIAKGVHESGSDRAHEVVRGRVSGMSDKEMAEVADLSGSISAKYKSLSTTEIMHTARNIRSVVGSVEEATKTLDPLMKLRVVAQGAHPERVGELDEVFDKLIKGMEIKGVTQDHAQFQHYIDNMAKAINVFGDTLRPDDYYETFKYGRAATNALSDRFILETAPTLAQELGGSSAGKALSGFHTQFVGGIMKHHAVKQLADLGMIDRNKVEYNKVGDVKRVRPGFMKVGAEYLVPGQEDPYAWTQAAVEHLKKLGKSDEEIQQLFTSISSREPVAQLLNTFFKQRARIEKDWELIRKSMGTDAAQVYLDHDPKIADQAVQKQLDNYLGNAGAALSPAYTAGANWLASGLSYVSGWAQQHPAKNTAGLAWLGSVSTAVSAAVAKGVWDGLRGGSLSAGSFNTSGVLRTGVLAGASLDIATREDVLPPGKLASQLLDQDKFNRLADLDALDRAHRSDPYGSPSLDADALDRQTRERAGIESQLAAKGYAPAGVPGRGLMAGAYTVEDLQRALGISSGPGEAVKAEVIGEATLKTEVTVSASPDFLTRVRQEVQNSINAFRSSGQSATGSTGSTGRSMPEAGPAP
ncbi:hypothetical protein [Bradyrhizobium sp. SZCCHNS2096]|uniref:hypothetical protein n=1 Tax=Bradyrhizobium sp. SZCCHNS2096 TaxID=3057309 RepID=UPI002916527D|nr:hypothetical protein [Bradyrhizobium sp. SZCCHNS2096]